VSSFNLLDRCPPSERAKVERLRAGEHVIVRAEGNATDVHARGVVTEVAADAVWADLIRIPIRARLTRVTPGTDLPPVTGDEIHWAQMTATVRPGDTVKVVETRGDLTAQTTGVVTEVTDAGLRVGGTWVSGKNPPPRVVRAAAGRLTALTETAVRELLAAATDDCGCVSCGAGSTEYFYWAPRTSCAAIPDFGACAACHHAPGRVGDLLRSLRYVREAALPSRADS
jgi:hypothetical protein